ncbi:MAG: nucleoside deaminase [Rhabdochlamydiaceae bacterium]|nr:nucleoside deaminase [Candidatus Amphrikana amoebophyrae]
MKGMELAFEEAQKAFDEDEVPIGAALELNGKIIATGHNMTEQLKNGTKHAEMVCIERATEVIGDFRLTGSILYITLEPCIMCAGALILSRVSKIVYACPDFRHGACGSIIDVFAIDHPIHQIEVERVYFQERSAKLLKDFFKIKRSK